MSQVTGPELWVFIKHCVSTLQLKFSHISGASNNIPCDTDKSPANGYSRYSKVAETTK